MVQSVPDKPLVALQSVLQQMREQSNSKVLIELALGYIGNVFVAPLIWLAVYDYNQHQLIGQGGVTLLEDLSLLTSTMPLQPGEILEQVVIEQRPISLPDMSQEPRMGFWQQQAKGLGGIQGCLIYPIQHQRRCMGVLMLGSQVWGVTTTEEEKALLGILLGQLAASLSHLESVWKQQMERRVDEPLLSLGQSMIQLTSLEERIEAVATELQTFVGVSRVQVYWLDRQESQFTPRRKVAVKATPEKGASALPPGLSTGLGDKPGPGAKSAQAKQPLALSIRELGDMYYTLADGQVVCASEASGTARSEITPKLMQQLRAQAVMAAPILLGSDLLGFISLESDVPRAWEDVERQMISGTANLLALAAPLEKLEVALEQVRHHQGLTAQIMESLYTQTDVQPVLQMAISGLCDQLNASACLALRYQPSSETFAVVYDHRKEAKLTFPREFGPLNDMDWSDMISRDVVVAENYSQDLRLLSWRGELEPRGVKSLMFCHTEPDEAQASQGIEGAILVVHQQLRAWSREERELLQAVSQQLGLMLRQSEMEQTLNRQEQLITNLIASATNLQLLQSLPDIYSYTVESVAQMLSTPLAVIVSWVPGETQGQVTAPLNQDPNYKLAAGLTVDIYQDPLIAQTLQSPEGLVEQQVDDLLPATRSWLSAPGIQRVLSTPLGMPDGFSTPLGILLVVKSEGRWEMDEQLALTLMGHTCGWAARRLLWTQTLQERGEILSELNWFKHRRLFDMQTALLDGLKRLGQVPEIKGDEATRWQKVVEIARGLRDLTAQNQSLLKHETWVAHPQDTTVPVAALIRKGLRRVESLVQKRKLWPRVHGDTGFAIYGDPARLEMVLHEVLTAAVLRSPIEARLDVWVQHGEYLEMLIVDKGELDPQLMEALQSEDPVAEIYIDPLDVTPLSSSPGLELSLCQRLIQRMGGQLSFYRADEGNTVSQFLMPFVGGEESN